MNHLEEALHRAGYARSPNNIHSLPGSLWYAGGPGLPEPKGIMDELLVGNDGSLQIVQSKFEGVPYVCGKYVHKTIASFDSVPGMIEWLKVNGKVSKPGLPAFSNSWD